MKNFSQVIFKDREILCQHRISLKVKSIDMLLNTNDNEGFFYKKHDVIVVTTQMPIDN